MGTARSDVIDFLKARNISIQDSRDINYYKGPQTIWGQVAASEKYDVVKTEAALIFEFDDKGILTAYQMKKQMVGP